MAPGFTDQAYTAAGKALFLLFVLAVVLESALAVLFNWRPFVERLNARAVRPLIAFVVALIFIAMFDLDIVTGLVNESTDIKYPTSPLGITLTAMVVAGGSAGVNNLLVALGFRQVRTPETVAAQKPPADTAWIAVTLNRREAVGDVLVCIGPPPAGAEVPVIGVIHGKSVKGWRFFLSDPGRSPGYGGWSIPAERETVVILRGKKRVSETELQDITAQWGPHKLAGRAIVDIELTL